MYATESYEICSRILVSVSKVVFTLGKYTRSLGLWGSFIVGPNEIALHDCESLETIHPHSNHAWYATTRTALHSTSLYIFSARRTSGESGSSCQPG